jgi:carboxylesterase
MTAENNMIMPGGEPFFFPGNSIGCLLVHGFTGTPKEMRLLGKYLSELGYTVLAIRLAGHATQPADMLKTRWHDWLLSVEDGLDVLKGCTQKVFILGLSMGGILTLTAASRYQFDGIVSMSTPYRLPNDWRLHLIGIIKWLIPQIGKGEDDWYDPQSGVGHISYEKYPTRSIQELSELVKVMQSGLHRVVSPALILQSRNDGVVSPDNAQMIFEAIGSQQKEIKFVEKSGHVIIEDTNRQQVFEAISSFIQKY